jgi:hypothetical protein
MDLRAVDLLQLQNPHLYSGLAAKSFVHEMGILVASLMSSGSLLLLLVGSLQTMLSEVVSQPNHARPLEHCWQILKPVSLVQILKPVSLVQILKPVSLVSGPPTLSFSEPGGSFL